MREGAGDVAASLVGAVVGEAFAELLSRFGPYYGTTGQHAGRARAWW